MNTMLAPKMISLLLLVLVEGSSRPKWRNQHSWPRGREWTTNFIPSSNISLCFFYPSFYTTLYFSAKFLLFAKQDEILLQSVARIERKQEFSNKLKKSIFKWLISNKILKNEREKIVRTKNQKTQFQPWLTTSRHNIADFKLERTIYVNNWQTYSCSSCIKRGDWIKYHWDSPTNSI